jgi:hypothetical protein
LRPHERVTLEHLFEGGGQTARMSGLKNRFYVALPVIKKDLFASLKQQGMYTVDPESAIAYVVVATIVIAAPFVLLHAAHVLNLLQSAPVAIISVAVAAAVIILFGRKMSAKSLKGMRTWIKILGFQEFMNRVDADRLKRLPPDPFEKYLPYAMALGVEHRWAQAFQDILREPPQWYVGPTRPGMMWNPILFTNSMHSMSTDLHSVMATATVQLQRFRVERRWRRWLLRRRFRWRGRKRILVVGR